MGIGKKPDFPPLLAPGRHVLDLMQIKALCRDAFADCARRRHLYQRAEEFIQEYLVSGIVCEVWFDGSFVTEKPAPRDVDVTVIIDSEVASTLSDAQLSLIDKTNDAHFSPDVDAFAYVSLPRNHPDYWDELLNPSRTWHEQYGLENSDEWLKGFAVLKLRETDVGLRLCS